MCVCVYRVQKHTIAQDRGAHFRCIPEEHVDNLDDELDQKSMFGEVLD